MNAYMGSFPKHLFQLVFNGSCRTMCLFQSYLPIHTDMQFDGIIIADSAGTQMVGLAHSREREYSLLNLFLHIFRQRLFKQFVQTRNQQPYRDLHDKETDYHRSNRIEHPPMISQQDGTADTDGRPDRRQCITPVMPGIGYHSLGVQLLALNHCILIKYLL